MSNAVQSSNVVHALVGRTLKIVKGCRKVWCGVQGRARYIDVVAGEKWRVEVARDVDGGGAGLVLSRGLDRICMGTAQRAKLERPQFNLNTGDPTKFVTVTVQP